MYIYMYIKRERERERGKYERGEKQQELQVDETVRGTVPFHGDCERQNSFGPAGFQN
jgi:hypothetical protein